MQSQPNGATRERVDFSKIKASIPIPNLIEVQKKSYERFLHHDAVIAGLKQGAPHWFGDPESDDE